MARMVVACEPSCIILKPAAATLNRLRASGLIPRALPGVDWRAIPDMVIVIDQLVHMSV
jgi:hypothetical protein